MKSLQAGMCQRPRGWEREPGSCRFVHLLPTVHANDMVKPTDTRPLHPRASVITAAPVSLTHTFASIPPSAPSLLLAGLGVFRRKYTILNGAFLLFLDQKGKSPRIRLYFRDKARLMGEKQSLVQRSFAHSLRRPPRVRAGVTSGGRGLALLSARTGHAVRSESRRVVCDTASASETPTFARCLAASVSPRGRGGSRAGRGVGTGGRVLVSHVPGAAGREPVN